MPERTDPSLEPEQGMAILLRSDLCFMDNLSNRVDESKHESLSLGLKGVLQLLDLLLLLVREGVTGKDQEKTDGYFH